MPYIEPHHRERLDTLLGALSSRIADEGELNYCMSKLALGHLGDSPRYSDHNTILGVFIGALLEFYRTRTAQYEDVKRVVNGPVTAGTHTCTEECFLRGNHR